jgi:hypothetical protein
MSELHDALHVMGEQVATGPGVVAEITSLWDGLDAQVSTFSSESLPTPAVVSRIAQAVRQRFELGQVDPAVLKRLYRKYNPIPDLDRFIEHARHLFPT